MPGQLERLYKLAWQARVAGQIEDAQKQALELLRLAKSIADPNFTIHSYSLLGQLACDQDDLDSSVRYYATALELAGEVASNLSLKAKIHKHLGSLALRKHEFSEAKSHLESALALYQTAELQPKLDIANIHRLLALVFEQTIYIPIPLSICSPSAASGTQVQGARMK